MMKTYAKTALIITGIIFMISMIFALLSITKITPKISLNKKAEIELDVNDPVIYAFVTVDQLYLEKFTVEKVYLVYVSQNPQLTILVEPGSLSSIRDHGYKVISPLIRDIQRGEGRKDIDHYVVMDRQALVKMNSIYEDYKKDSILPQEFNFCGILAVITDDEWNSLIDLYPDHIQSDSFDDFMEMKTNDKLLKGCHYELVK